MNLLKRIFFFIVALCMISVTAYAEGEAVSLLREDALTSDGSWVIEVSGAKAGYGIERAFDGNVKTYWHSNYDNSGSTITSRDEPPHIITVTFPESKTISGVRYVPRQINGADTSDAGIWKTAEIYTSVDGENFTLAAEKNYSASIISERVAEDIKIPEGSYKAVRITVTSSKSSYGTAGEIQFFKGEAEKLIEKETAPSEKLPGAIGFDSNVREGCISRTQWRIKASTVRGGFPAENILDGKEKTYWHSNYISEGTTITSFDSPPYEVELILPSASEISGMILCPRKDQDIGRFLRFNVWASPDDNEEYQRILSDAEISKGKTEEIIDFYGNIKVKRIKLEILATNARYGCLSELYLMAKKEDYSFISYDKVKEGVEANRLYPMDQSEFVAVSSAASFQNKEDRYGPDMAFDGSKSTIWLTNPGENDITMTLDMAGIHTVNALEVTPRQDRLDGTWLTFSVLASIDGENFEPVFEKVKWEENKDIKKLTFEGGLKARFIKFEIISSNINVASAAEIQLYQTRDNKDASKKHYRLKIGEKKIEVLHGEGKTIELDVSPFIVNGTTLIPLRGLLEEMGAEITWNGENQSILVKSEKVNMEFTLQIANKLVYVKHPTYGDIRYTLLTTPEIKDNRTFIPLRFVSEILGYEVFWDGESQTIDITK